MFVVTNYCQIYNIMQLKLQAASIQAVCTALLKLSVNLIWQSANTLLSVFTFPLNHLLLRISVSNLLSSLLRTSVSNGWFNKDKKYTLTSVKVKGLMISISHIYSYQL